ncbi:MAG: hypothetical protein KH050_00070 [Clostridiaceae bacterium]|nr:hypothetical protein [Clostridiaceae bacterium]
MRGFDTIPGNEAVKDSLRAALSSRFPQAVLLTGPTGSGKMELARTLAAALLCTGEGDRPCGRCVSCHKLQNDAHPDLDIIDEGESDLPVSLARELRQKVCILPNDGDRRVVILRHAHKLNVPAQNALLKVLEEPPRYAFFILTSEQPGAVLETIRSRCTRYQLAPPQEAGSNQETWIPSITPFVQALADADEYRMLLAAMGLEKLQKADFKAVLGAFQSALRDAIFCANTLNGRIVPALTSETARLAVRVDSQRLLKLYDFVSNLSARTEINAAAAIQCAGLAAGAYQICYL